MENRAAAMDMRIIRGIVFSLFDWLYRSRFSPSFLTEFLVKRITIRFIAIRAVFFSGAGRSELSGKLLVACRVRCPQSGFFKAPIICTPFVPLSQATEGVGTSRKTLFFATANPANTLYLKAIYSFFNEKNEIPKNDILLTLNQRVQGSSPCASTTSTTHQTPLNID
jgi:hypothetical protein